MSKIGVFLCKPTFLAFGVCLWYNRGKNVTGKSSAESVGGKPRGKFQGEKLGGKSRGKI